MSEMRHFVGWGDFRRWSLTPSPRRFNHGTTPEIRELEDGSGDVYPIARVEVVR